MGLVDRHPLTTVQVIAGTAITIAGGLLVFGAFEPWDLRRASATCVANGHTGLEGAGQITLGLGITALLLGALMLAGVRPRTMSIAATVLFSVSAFFVLGYWLTRGV
ncbi:MAG TPA: hypothetical protein VG348_14475, partial [Acidimicrobiia bacterium]|nr:hypothetical protein [Acidimicrobiia bacterium]